MDYLDPLKLVEMLEELFGKKIGRWIATGIVALSVLASSLWLISLVWKYEGHTIYDQLSSISVHAPKIGVVVDLPAVQTMMFMLIVYSAILLGVLVLFVRRVFRTSIPQAVIDQLAEIRSRVIHEVLNAKIATDAEFDAWKALGDKW